MSVNLGNEALQGIGALRGDGNFTAFRNGLEEFAAARIHAALETAPDMRVEATAYARAIRDISIAIEAACNGVHPNRAPKTPLRQGRV
jgi:hypothetical protein